MSYNNKKLKPGDMYVKVKETSTWFKITRTLLDWISFCFLPRYWAEVGETAHITDDFYQGNRIVEINGKNYIHFEMERNTWIKINNIK